MRDGWCRAQWDRLSWTIALTNNDERADGLLSSACPMAELSNVTCRYCTVQYRPVVWQ